MEGTVEIAKSFSNKLRFYRKQCSLTQEEFGSRIGYTGKAVSKWEQGIVIPPVDTLVVIADFFNVTLDDLVGYCLAPIYYLGIDGGSSRTVFALANEKGEVEKTLILGASNPLDLGFEKSLAVLDAGIKQITDGIPRRQISLYAGISGGAMGDMRLRLSRFFETYGFARVQNQGDVHNIMMAALEEQDGIVIRMGTGSCAISKHGEETEIIGGFGYLFEEGGSAYAIGRESLKAAFMAEDGSGVHTKLVSCICEEFGFQSLRENLTHFYQIGKGGIAAISTLTFKTYKENKDKVAKKILQSNMSCVARMIATASQKFKANKENKTPIRVVLEGCLVKELDTLKPMLLEELKKIDDLSYYDISAYTGEIVYGALKAAGMYNVKMKKFSD